MEPITAWIGAGVLGIALCAASEGIKARRNRRKIARRLAAIRGK
jgi:hypothetical protein